MEIKVPVLGESVTEATVAKWLKSQGDSVKADEALLELETDKVTLEVFAPANGVLSEIVAPQGSTVEVGGLLGRLTEGAAGAATSKPAEKPTEKPATKAEAPKAASPSPSTDNLAPSVRRLTSEQNIDPTTIEGTGRGGRITKAMC